MIIVVIPTYNEKDNIKKLIFDILNLDKNLYVVVVDDNSVDGTTEIVKKIEKRKKRLYLVNLNKRQGRGKSGIIGFKFALNLGGDYILEMDGDYSYQPKYIFDFLNTIKEYDVVIGSRYVKGGKDRRGWGRRIISRLGGVFIRRVIRMKEIKDPTSGYRCFRKETLQGIKLNELVSQGTFIITEILYKCYKRNYRIKEIPIEFKGRSKGKSKLSFWTLLKYPLKVLDLKYTIE